MGEGVWMIGVGSRVRLVGASEGDLEFSRIFIVSVGDAVDSVGLNVGFAERDTFGEEGLEVDGLGVFRGDGTNVCVCASVSSETGKTDDEVGLEVGFWVRCGDGTKVCNCILLISETGNTD